MRRVSGPQSGSSYYLRKEVARLKSPQASKSKGKAQISSASHNLPTRKTSSFYKVESNQSSTNFTAHNRKKSATKTGKKKQLQKYEK